MKSKILHMDMTERDAEGEEVQAVMSYCRFEMFKFFITFM